MISYLIQADHHGRLRVCTDVYCLSSPLLSLGLREGQQSESQEAMWLVHVAWATVNWEVCAF